MQRYTGELSPADARRATPMIFDGWEYVPLDMSARTAQERSEPDSSQPVDGEVALRDDEADR